MDLLSVLSWILLSCLVLILGGFLIGSVVKLELTAQQAGRIFKRGVVLRLATWTMLSLYWTQEVDLLLAKAAILIIGVSVAIAAEIHQIKPLEKQKDATREM